MDISDMQKEIDLRFVTSGADCTAKSLFTNGFVSGVKWVMTIWKKTKSATTGAALADRGRELFLDGMAGSLLDDAQLAWINEIIAQIEGTG